MLHLNLCNLFDCNRYFLFNPVSAYGQEWESAEIYDVKTAYKTFFNREIIADVGVKIGLNSVNITLKCTVPFYSL